MQGIHKKIISFQGYFRNYTLKLVIFNAKISFLNLEQLRLGDKGGDEISHFELCLIPRHNFFKCQRI